MPLPAHTPALQHATCHKRAAVRAALAASWTARTASPLVAWTPSNPSSGQCAVSALVLQDYCGGEIRRCVVAGTPHYFNRIDGQVVDSTAAQFGTVAINYDTATVRSRQRILRHADTRRRYELLKGWVERLIGNVIEWKVCYE